jgi:predicted AlkP superfamily pyrophosphatase or phosphodiesterase
MLQLAITNSIGYHARMTSTARARRSIAAFLITLSIVFASFLVPVAPAQQSGRQAAKPSEAANPRPRLVLLIVVDQFRYDYLDRFGDLFGTNGLRRLQHDGASWVNTNYDHMPTYTAPGHATLMTGAYPAETGIVGNDWPDRETGKRVTSVSDDTVTLFSGGPKEAAASPRRLMASTLGDELRLATHDRSKVIGISLKDRAAILPAGRHANAAYWLSAQSGNMVSSSYYFTQLPNWVADFNNTHPADKYFGARWDRLLPEAEYLKRAGEDSPPWEDIGKVAGDTNAFPHTITGGAKGPGRDFYGEFPHSPFANEVLLSFAEQAIVNEQLGQDDDTDVLTLSFSSNDYVGHRYGPYSQELMDITLRVDQQIGALLDFVDKRVGLKNTTVIFSADHGMAPIPEHATALGLSGGRIKSSDVSAAIKAAISARYNRTGKTPDPTADYYFQYSDMGKVSDQLMNANLYFNLASLKRDGVNLDEIEHVACDAALTVPGIARCFTREQLLRGNVSTTDPIERRALHGFYPRRSGDIVLVQDPFKYLVEYVITATHGSPYSYDTHVPMIIMGDGFRPGRYFEAATPADIAPTLAAKFRVQPPSNAVGRVLIEALSGAPAK